MVGFPVGFLTVGERNEIGVVAIRGRSRRANTLKVESFAGRKFRDFASFLVVRESLYPRNRSCKAIRESLYPRIFLKNGYSRKFVPANFFQKWTLAKVCTREFFLKMESRESLYPRIIAYKRVSQNFIPVTSL